MFRPPKRSFELSHSQTRWLVELTGNLVRRGARVFALVNIRIIELLLEIIFALLKLNLNPLTFLASNNKYAAHKDVLLLVDFGDKIVERLVPDPEVYLLLESLETDEAPDCRSKFNSKNNGIEKTIDKQVEASHKKGQEYEVLDSFNESLEMERDMLGEGHPPRILNNLIENLLFEQLGAVVLFESLFVSFQELILLLFEVVKQYKSTLC